MLGEVVGIADMRYEVRDVIVVGGHFASGEEVDGFAGGGRETEGGGDEVNRGIDEVPGNLGVLGDL